MKMFQPPGVLIPGTLITVIINLSRYAWKAPIKSFIMGRWLFILTKTPDQRLIQAKIEQAQLRWGLLYVVGFFLTKNIDFDQKLNRRNDRWFCCYPTKILSVMHMKFRKNIVILGVVRSERRAMQSHFFQQELPVNNAVYLQFLNAVVWYNSVG